MQTLAMRYFILNKPFGIVSQFISSCAGPLLGDIGNHFPEGTHAIGRLDKHSEGLLLLTTNKKVTALLFQSKIPHKRTYLVQVKYKVKEDQLQQLRTGVSIRIKEGDYYTTPPCDVQIVEPPADIWPSPQTQYVYIESTWLLITLTEGKFRQVRKMVAAVKHNCMRLIRVSIEDMQLGDLKPGEVKEIEEADFFQQLKLETSSKSNLTIK
jgi:23S rRNA pseudouridine2457 synthase